jgi:hypothetical protein
MNFFIPGFNTPAAGCPIYSEPSERTDPPSSRSNTPEWPVLLHITPKCEDTIVDFKVHPDAATSRPLVACGSKCKGSQRIAGLCLRNYFWSSLLVPVPGLPIGRPFVVWPTPAFRSAWAADGDVPLAVGGWMFGLFWEALPRFAPVVVACVPIPDGAEGPELALFEEVPVPAPELAAAPALPPPAPPPPACAKTGDDRTMHASATIAVFLVMGDLPLFERAIHDRRRKFRAALLSYRVDFP